eukprot:m.85879 g.85879  ORF g.85879 m.85879 type:complete len:586 (-) comp14745_c0_seq1:68-1825(-)
MAAKQIPELVVKVTSAVGLELPDKVQIKEGIAKDVIVAVKTKNAQPKRQKTQAASHQDGTLVWQHELVFRNFSRTAELQFTVQHRNTVLAKGAYLLPTLPIEDYQESVTVSLTPRGSLAVHLQYRIGHPLFESPLQEVTNREATKVPILVQKCCSAVEEHGGTHEGLYRVSGSHSAVVSLQARFEANPHTVTFTEEELRHITSITSLLKRYLQSLPEPLLTNERQASFIAAVAKEPVEDAKAEVNQLLRELPSPQYRTIVYLLNHMQKMLTYKSTTLMDVDNFATVFGPAMTRLSPADMAAYADNAKLLTEMRKPEAGNNVVKFLLKHPEVVQQVEARRDTSTTSFDLSQSQLPSEWSDDDSLDHTVPADLYAMPHKVRPGHVWAQSTRSPTRRRSSPAYNCLTTPPPSTAADTPDSPYASVQELESPVSQSVSFATLIASPARTPTPQAKTLHFGKTALAEFLAHSTEQHLDHTGLRVLSLRKGVLITPREATTALQLHGNGHSLDWGQFRQWWGQHSSKLSNEAKTLLKRALELFQAHGMQQGTLTPMQWRTCCQRSGVGANNCSSDVSWEDALQHLIQQKFL